MATKADMVSNLEQELAFQRTLTDIVNQIHSAPSISDILLNLSGPIRDLLDCDRLTIYAVDLATLELYSIVQIDDLPQMLRLPRSPSSIAGFCAVTRQVVNIRDAYDQKHLASIHPSLTFDQRWDKSSGYRTKQNLATPILFDSYLLGVLQLINKHKGGSFTKADEAAAQEIARSLGIAFYNQNRATRIESGTTNQFSRLVDKGLLGAADLDAALAHARNYRKDPAALLMARHGIAKQAVGQALSEFYDCPFFADDGERVIPDHLRHRATAGFWLRNRAAPLERKPGLLTVAVADPFDLNTINTIKAAGIAPHLQIQVATESDIASYVRRSFGIAEDAPAEAPPAGEADIEKLLGELKAEVPAEEEEGDDRATLAASEADSVMVRFVNKCIFDAHRAGASDIHIEPNGHNDPCVIRFRRDGDCYRYQTVPAAHRSALVSRVKIMAQLDIAEKRKPQDGKIRMPLPDGNVIELRVATIPTAGSGNEDVVLRILASSTPLRIDELKMHPDNLKVFKEIASKPYGIILCVGPTGSGKTTTLHSVLGHLNTEDVKIWTAEDPVEITQKGARQVQVNPRIGFTFAAAMRAFLRADPDIIMLGEMRDAETASIGVEASLTGHLVLSTLHTSTAPEAITRLLDMGQDPFNFSTALLCVLAQRLARTLCKRCKEPYHPGAAEVDALAQLYGETDPARGGLGFGPDLRLYRAEGCEDCAGTGYRGRIGLHELLVVSDRIREMIVKRAPVDSLRDAAIEEGMTTLMQDGVRKILDGHTDLRQVRAVCMR